jgi:hypothetical protein
MDRVLRAIDLFAARIGASVGSAVLDRSDTIALSPPGRVSANGSALMVQAADGWIAVNLPRKSDVELIPAWLSGEGDDWAAIERVCAARPIGRLIADARVLGLAVAAVGETASTALPRPRTATPGVAKRLTVVDLSALWAGPLCAALLGQAGADILKIEHVGRPDPAPVPLSQRLNGGKRRLTLDFAHPDGRAELRARILAADVVVTSARPRAFEQLGLAPRDLLAIRPALLWVAISAYGWVGAHTDRIGFGDDAAAAGGLVRWERGEPRFLGDALADPLAGLAAAAAALEALGGGRRGLIDIGLAPVAAGVAGLRC